jgi:hypothetical protein
MKDSLIDTLQNIPLKGITGTTGLIATNVITNAVGPAQVNSWWQLICNVIIGGLTMWHLFKKKKIK